MTAWPSAYRPATRATHRRTSRWRQGHDAGRDGDGHALPQEAGRRASAEFTGPCAYFEDGRPALHFDRLAVTPAQITAMALPTRPTKQTDSRAAKFAGEPVEVDAILAPVLRTIIETAIEQHIDPDALRMTKFAEQSERDLLTHMRHMTGGAA